MRHAPSKSTSPTLASSGNGGLQVSVVVPAYNAEKSLPGCLKSLKDQTIPPDLYEIIVVDDGSIDRTAEVAASAGVRVIRVPHRGAGIARNMGVSQARGRFIVFTDADCEPAPDFLEWILKPLASAKVSGSRGVYRSRQKAWVARFVQMEYEERYRRIAHYQDKHGTINALDTSYAAYKRDAFLGAGGFDIRFGSAAGEDHELSFRMALAGHVFRFVPEAKVYHLHVNTVREYLRRKFRIGFWKAFLTKMHPGYAVSDSHMTHSLKLQIVLSGLIWPLLLLWPLWPPAGWILALCSVLFILSSLPLMILIARRDPPILLISLPMILARSTASGIGFGWGVLHAGPRADRPEMTITTEES